MQVLSISQTPNGRIVVNTTKWNTTEYVSLNSAISIHENRGLQVQKLRLKAGGTRHRSNSIK